MSIEFVCFGIQKTLHGPQRCDNYYSFLEPPVRKLKTNYWYYNVTVLPLVSATIESSNSSDKLLLMKAAGPLIESCCHCIIYVI